MESYSEIECAFISFRFSNESFFKIFELLKENCFRLNEISPGYVCSDEFEYPEWKTIEQALEQIKNERYHSFCINLQSQKSPFKYDNLSVEADIESKCIAVKISEEVFIDKETNKISRSCLVEFVGLMQKLAPYLNVVAWKIAQSGFDYDFNGGSGFVRYSSDVYPEAKIDELIIWYDQEYLSRWN